jgi:hypothetical protein
MFTQAVLAYSVSPVSTLSLAQLAARVAAVVLPTGPGGDVAQIYGATLISDVTAIVGARVVRTITLGLGTLFNSEFLPASDPVPAFRKLYQPVLANALQSQVFETAPVVT